MPVIDFRDTSGHKIERMPVVEFRDVSSKQDEGGVFYDQPVVPAARVQSRDVAWQPLKRSWQPLKRDHADSDTGSPAKFQLLLRDNVQLRQQLIEAVENHLLSDLNAAQQYGIKPEQILLDLQEKNSERHGESS